MRNRSLLIAGVLLVATSTIGAAVQGAISGPQEWWPGHMFGGGHMGRWSDTSRTSSLIEGAEVLVVTATDFGFSPAELVVQVGEPVNLTLVNEGAVPHDLTILGLAVHVEAGPGQRVTVGMVPEKTGSFDILCTYPGHSDLGMTGVMVVRDSG
ncbi:MAG TPA: cupredoxin domain-containing protein [Acidimicrobiia bacterium]|nr:cupredoxin domain-containing protein [Acidimicrobiia bacterium]